jgi:L,D-transpeptidase catalytic domain
MKRVGGNIAVGLLVAAVAVTAAAASTLAARSSRAPELSLRWSASTPADGSTYTVQVGDRLSVRLGATAGAQVQARGLPRGGALTRTSFGAVLTWTPAPASAGPHPVVITARKPGTDVYAAPRTLFLYGRPAAAPAGSPTTPQSTPLASPGVSRWAYVMRSAVARSAPNGWSRVVTKLSPYTLDETPNLVLLLESTTDVVGRVWYHVRLPIRPNNSTGWVLGGALTATHVSRTYLVVDRRLLVATLYRGSRPIFRTRVGVGRSYWPTPRGDFYVREVLTGFKDPMYGPVAFGTSARSGVLTDWNGGGGVIGIHGTDQPQILPGFVSHGCIRMPNPAILRLHRLMGLGTPVAIR